MVLIIIKISIIISIMMVNSIIIIEIPHPVKDSGVSSIRYIEFEKKNKKKIYTPKK